MVSVMYKVLLGGALKSRPASEAEELKMELGNQVSWLEGREFGRQSAILFIVSGVGGGVGSLVFKNEQVLTTFQCLLSLTARILVVSGK